MLMSLRILKTKRRFRQGTYMVTTITLYLAHDANLLEVQRMLLRERVASSNIRKRTTRVAVQRALDNLLP